MDWDDLIGRFKPVDFKSIKTDRSGNVFIETGDINLYVYPPEDKKGEYLAKLNEIQAADITPQMQRIIEEKVRKQLVPIKNILSSVSGATQIEVLGATFVNSVHDAVKKGTKK